MSISWAPVPVWPWSDLSSRRSRHREVPKVPRRHLVVVMCMDARLDESVLGLRPGDAHVIRNAGGFVSDDVLRSIAISQRYLKTRRVLLVAHTDCGALHVDQQAMLADIGRDVGGRPSWVVDAARTPEAALERGRHEIESCRFLTSHEVDTAIYDVQTRRVRAWRDERPPGRSRGDTDPGRGGRGTRQGLVAGRARREGPP